MKITVDQIMAWGPCSPYTDARVRELVGDGLTPREIAALDIPPEDRFWALTNLLDERDCRLLACDIAESVVHFTGDDPRCVDAIRISRRYAFGLADHDELSIARAAARASACDATWAAVDAARATADAAWAAARTTAASAWPAWAAVAAARATADAAWAAARATADAAWDTADAALHVAWDAHIARALDYIEGRVDIDALRESVVGDAT